MTLALNSVFRKILTQNSKFRYWALSLTQNLRKVPSRTKWRSNSSDLQCLKLAEIRTIESDFRPETPLLSKIRISGICYGRIAVGPRQSKISFEIFIPAVLFESLFEFIRFQSINYKNYRNREFTAKVSVSLI